MSMTNIHSKTPLMVMSAPNGARLQKADHAGLPISPTELAEEAKNLLEAGVSVLHLHVRDADNQHSLDADLYRAALSAIKQAVGDKLVLQVTTEAVGMYDRHQQMALVNDLKPEAVSLALRELCPDDSCLSEASAFFSNLRSFDCWPQYILYSPEDVIRFDTYRKDGVFGDDTPSALFVLGRYSSSLTGDPGELDAFLQACPSTDFPWSVCCFGKTEHQAALRAVQNFGHVRLGFENNRWLPSGELAPTNAMLITETIKSISAALPEDAMRPLANADWVRAHFAAS
ncbi:3-keto-5-aminohexanoate cleavage enzyme [Kordiimonas sediminis]|uniref:3-keto-5-aminohexanoate cleavage enzyme n=1 Tax=Kordiimonas sediminis TaxID=1735581 RepID=A0A919AME4_9PROT|nr:3-keto-5-aminohexanoate cleavage protein [Kordiimonas sediminis]GHF14780.1 3-keto-5-aminohexanoate cleavage enzyme [Kordiimonas sediminis]